MDQNEALHHNFAAHEKVKHVPAHYSGWYSPENVAELIGFAGLLLSTAVTIAVCIYSVPDKYQLVSSVKAKLLHNWLANLGTNLVSNYFCKMAKKSLRWLVWSWSFNQAVYLEMFHTVAHTSPADAWKTYVGLEKCRSLFCFTQCLIFFGSQRQWQVNKHMIAACQHVASSVGSLSQTYF